MSTLLKFMSMIAPGYAARKIHKFISNPRVRKLRKFEERVLAESKRARVPFRNFEIQSYSWGEAGKPIALFVHGWEGQAGNFANLVSLLNEKGYHVVAYDGPSHGKSTQQETNMFEYADFITDKIAAHKPDIIVSHSFGTITTLLGLVRNPKFSLKQWFIVTTPFSFHDYVNELMDELGVTNRTFIKLTHLLEKDTEYSLEELNVATSAKELTGLGQCTIVHSPQDKVLPVENSRKVHQHLTGSKLVEPKNLGHYKILWSNVLKDILDEEIENIGHVETFE